MKESGSECGEENQEKKGIGLHYIPLHYIPLQSLVTQCEIENKSLKCDYTCYLSMDIAMMVNREQQPVILVEKP